jgi:DGQHR domain-containing protein
MLQLQTRRRSRLKLTADFVQKHYGDHIDLGPCVLGRNLNLLTARGHASLDQLALISSPDVYDQIDNKTGTQRDLNKPHARACYEYALGYDVPPEEYPRFFPEILLNARDTGCLELYNPADPTELYDFDSLADDAEIPASSVTGVRFRLDRIKFPKRSKGPQISRVDGNHRLYGTDEVLEEASDEDLDVEENFPTASFSLLIGLNANQEASLFRDINGEHQGMDVAHLDQLAVRITTEAKLKDDTDPKRRALWIAYKLSEAGFAFEDMVYMGGAKEGLRSRGLQPPIKINALKSTVLAQLKGAPVVAGKLKDKPEAMLRLIDNYWQAVRASFPEAWGNRKDFILLQAIGLGAFARFGASVMERGWESGAITQEDFERDLVPIKKSVSLERTTYPGIAGAGGQQYIFNKLIEASDPDAVKTEKLIAQLEDEPDVDTKLGLAGDTAAS